MIATTYYRRGDFKEEKENVNRSKFAVVVVVVADSDSGARRRVRDCQQNSGGVTILASHLVSGSVRCARDDSD